MRYATASTRTGFARRYRYNQESIHSMELIPKILEKIEIQDKTIFRGHAAFKWELKPSIGRYYHEDWTDVLEIEKNR